MIKNLRPAFRGILLPVKSEWNLKIQLSILVFVVLLGFVFNISFAEWGLVLLCSALVISLEIANTAIEKLCDFIHKDYHKDIGNIKDISSGAVLIASIFSFIIGIIIFAPKVFNIYN